MVEKSSKSKVKSEGGRPRRRRGRSSSRKKAIKLLLVVIVVVVLIAVALFGFSPKEYVTVGELLENKDLYENKDVELRGKIAIGSIDAPNQTFSIKGGGKELLVVSNQVLPDQMGEGKQVVAKGKLGKDGIFMADKITVGCPSKYEEGSI